MCILLFNLILRSHVATLTGLLLLITLALVLIASPLFIIAASRWEDWRILREWRAQQKANTRDHQLFSTVRVSN